MRTPTSPRRRALGQHFLSNVPAARRIVELFSPAPGAHVIEIGPGRGVLTELLLATGARVTAIEIDRRLAAGLKERLGPQPGFRLIEADVLRCDLTELAGGAPARVLANLPYAITGEVLARLVRAAGCLTDATLMLQREVANRIVASPGGRLYGSLSVLVQYFTSPRVIMTLAPGSFTPPPAVSSAVVQMPFRPARELPADREREYPEFIRMLFAHRRRTLLNNLKAAAIPSPEAALDRSGIAPERRAETLARGECLRLFEECGTTGGRS